MQPSMNNTRFHRTNTNPNDTTNMTPSYIISAEDRSGGSGVFPINEDSEDLLEKRRPLTYGNRFIGEPMPKRRRSSAASDADNYIPANSPANPNYLSSSAPGFLASKCASAVVAMEVDNESRRDGLTQTPVSSPGSTPPSSAGESPPESVRVSPKENPGCETAGKEEGKEAARPLADVAESKQDMPNPLLNVAQPAHGGKEDDRDTSKSSSLAKVEEEDSDLAEHDDEKHATKSEKAGESQNVDQAKEEVCEAKPARASPHLQADPSDAVASPTPLDDRKKGGSAPTSSAGIPLLHFLNAERQGIPPMSFMSGSVPMPVANAQYQLQTLPRGSAAPVAASTPASAPSVAPGTGPLQAPSEARPVTIIPPKPLPSFRDMMYSMPNEKGPHSGVVPPMKAETGVQSVYAPPPPQDKVPRPTSMPMASVVPPMRETPGQVHPDSKDASPRAETAVNLTPTVTHINYPIRRVSMSRFFSFVDPTGHVYTVSNLRGFCQARGLNRAHMSSVFRGKRQHHKGWRRASVPGVPFPEENAQLSGKDDDSDDENEDQVLSSGLPASVCGMRCGPRGSGPRVSVGDVKMVCSMCSKDASFCQCQRVGDMAKASMVPPRLTSYDGKAPLSTPTQEVAAMDLSTPRSDNSGERRLSGGFSRPGPVMRRPSGSSGANLLDLIAKCAEDVNTKTVPSGVPAGNRPRSYSMMNPTLRRDSIVSSSQDMMHRPRTDSLPHPPRPRKDSINSEGARVRSKLFAFVDPYGNKYQVDNLSKLCEMFDLTPSTMSKVHRGVRLQHKGWQRVETEEKLGIVLPSSIRKAPALPVAKLGTVPNSSKLEGATAGTSCGTAVKTASPDSANGTAKGKSMPAPSFAPTMPLDTESETDSDDSTTSFHFVDSDGNVENPVDLLAFCQVRGLSFTLMKKVSRGTVDSHKGWRRKGGPRLVNGSSMGSVDEELDKIHDNGNENANECGRSKSPCNSPQSFAFIDPHGVRHECSKLSSFCRTHNLTQSSMSKVHRGVRFQHKGWRKADGGKARSHRKSGPTAEGARRANDRTTDSDTDSDMDEANEGDGEGRGLRLYQKVSTSFSFTDPTGKTHNVINLSKFCDDHKLARSAMSKVHRGIRPQHKGWRKTETPASAPRLSYAFIGPNGELAEVSDLSRFCQSYNLQLESMKDVARGELAQYEGWRNADESDSSDDDDTPLNEIMKKSKNACQGRGDKIVSQTGFIVNGGERRKSRGRPSNLSRKLAAARTPEKDAGEKATTPREPAVTGLHFLAFASEQIETMDRTVQT